MTLTITSIETVESGHPKAIFTSVRTIDQQAAHVASLPPHSAKRAKAQHVLEMMKHEQLQQEVQSDRGYAARRAAMAMREGRRG